MLHALYFEGEDLQDGAKSDNQNQNAEDGNWARVHPNPFNAHITIELKQDEIDGGAVVAFYDLAGRKVSQAQLQHGQAVLIVDGNTLPKGVLIYEIISGRGEVQRGKLIKMQEAKSNSTPPKIAKMPPAMVASFIFLILNKAGGIRPSPPQ